MTPIERMLNEVEYKPVAPPEEIGTLPYVTHEGIMMLGEIELEVFVLSDGRRIISEDSLVKFFGEDTNLGLH
jgi:hypothetical protein